MGVEDKTPKTAKAVLNRFSIKNNDNNNIRYNFGTTLKDSERKSKFYDLSH